METNKKENTVTTNTKKEKAIKVLVEITRVILGTTFLFSGFVKAVDPFGTAYKIQDYFTAFGLTSLSFMSLPLSALQSIAELLMGIFLLLGIYRRWNTRLILLTMLFMTPLTLYLAIGNPVDDCGCFGDAIIITNWETFFKNLVLLACAIFLVIQCERITNFFTGKTYWLAFFYLIIASGLFIFHNYLFEPIFDFRPYKIGANIKELSTVEDGKGRVEETVLIYAKDGKNKEFTDQNAPWDDDTWEYVDMKTKLISEGESSTIKDFGVNHLILNKEKTQVVAQNIITDSILNNTNYTFLMIAPSLSTINYTYISNFEDVSDYAREYGYEFYMLTASGSNEIIEWKNKHTIDFEFCNADERTLKTIMRSNPGLLLMKDGIIVNKWAGINTPAEEDLTAPLEELAYGQKIDTARQDNRNYIYISLLFILPLLLLKMIDVLFYKKNKIEKIK